MRQDAHLSLVLSDKPLSYMGGGLPLRLPATSLRACLLDAGEDSSILSCLGHAGIVLSLATVPFILLHKHSRSGTKTDVTFDPFLRQGSW